MSKEATEERVASSRVASAVSRVLRDRGLSKSAKVAAGSALTQRARRGLIYQWNVLVIPKDQFETASECQEAVVEAVDGVRGVVMTEEMPGAWIVKLPSTVSDRHEVVRQLKKAGITARVRFLRAGRKRVNYF